MKQTETIKRETQFNVTGNYIINRVNNTDLDDYYLTTRGNGAKWKKRKLRDCSRWQCNDGGQGKKLMA